jgi:hypothetical protein
MNYTFQLKEPKSKERTLIYFVAYFKEENKKFKYSTGEKIKPDEWDFNFKRPFLKGASKSNNASTINLQLNRYSDLYLETFGLYQRINETLTSVVLKKVFDENFKKTVKGKNIFFDAYDTFVEEKKKGKEWSEWKKRSN